MNTDVYARVTDSIVQTLEQGVRPWVQPWQAGHAAGPVSRPLRHNGLPYSGINILMLWAAATEKDYVAPIWMTFKQAQELGAHVRKGEHGSPVVYANTFTRTETDKDTGEDVERDIPFLRGYTVFNVEQIDGLPDHYYAKAAAPVLDGKQRLDRLEAFFAATGADIRHGGNRAYYAIDPDYVQMPPFESFRDVSSYYATLAHESTHWTRHPSRLARDLGRKSWGDAGYAMEELVAEIGSAFLCADLGLTPEVRDDHAAYVASWLTVLKHDKKAIFTAASHAQRAADYLLGLQPAPATAPEGPAERIAQSSSVAPGTGVAEAADPPAAPPPLTLVVPASAPARAPAAGTPGRPFNAIGQSPAATSAAPSVAPAPPRQGELFPL